MTLHDINGVVVLTPRGHLYEGDESDQLEAALESLLRRDVTRIVVNLSEAEHLSARAVGIIAHVHSVATVKGGHLAVCGVHGDHQRLFEITGLSQVLDLRATEEEAVARLRAFGQAVA